MSLLERQRFGDDPDLLAAERIEAFPEAPLGAAVSPEPFFAASRGTAGAGFGDRPRCPRSCANHEIHRYFRDAFSFSPLIRPSASTRPVRVSDEQAAIAVVRFGEEHNFIDACRVPV